MSRSLRGRTRRSIQARVMLLVALGVVASMLVPGWVAWEALGEVTAQAVSASTNDAALAARHLEQVLNREWNKLQEIAAAPAPTLPLAGTDAPTSSVFVPPAEVLRTVYFRAEIMDRTFVTDAAGRVTMQEPAGTRGLGDEVPGARTAMLTGRPGVSPADAGSGALHLLVPIRDWHGAVIGVAGGSVSRTGPRLAGILRTHAGLPARVIEVLDQRGTVVTALPQATVGSTSDHHVLAERQIRAGAAASGACRTCHESGPRSSAVMAFAPLRSVPWGILLRTPEHPGHARAERLRRVLLWLAPALLGIGLLFAWGAAQSLLRPVRILTRESERIAAGGLDRAIPDLGRDELGRLGRSLDHMRARLKDLIDTVEHTNATLERRVDERTQELQILSRELADREEARARLLRQVITAQEDERKRLARELHDETCQTISALTMRLETATRLLPDADAPPALAEARALAVRALDELHRLIYDLRPSVLDDLGLWSAIRWYAERHLAPKGVSVRCEFPDGDDRLPPIVETALFRVAQEAISNIAKHSGADLVLIQGGISGDALTMEIEDDGKGFDPSEARRPTADGHGWGLLGITERVDALGGQVELDTAPGQGVRLVVTVTLPAEASRA